MRARCPISAHEKRENVPLWNPSKSAFRASPAPRGHRPPSGGKFELLQPRARRKHVISAPRRELRTPVLLTTKQLLWLPRSARRADGDETRSRATSGETGGWADRNATFCCSFCARRSLLPDARGENSPAASRRALQIPSYLFAPERAEKKVRNQAAPLISETFVCLR